MNPDTRRRIANRLVAEQYDRPTPQDTPVVERGGIMPLATYGDGRTGLAWPEMIAGPANRFYQAATGQLTPGTDAFREAGAEVGMAAMTGGLLASRPANSVGTFAGRLAKTADYDALARAEDMAGRGVPREQIWTETGWFKAPDGRWKWEIDDSGAQLDLTGALADGWQPNQKWPIDHVLTHKQLAAAYPDMNSRGIFYREFPQGFDDAAASTTKDASIALNSRYRDFGRDEPMKSSVLHEGQHVVQRSEGFARGGSPREFSPGELAAERARVMAIPEDPNSWNISTASGDMSDLDAGRSLYRRLAGEVEARAVQKRLDMTPAERRARPPWLDYDVPEGDQIVKFSNPSPAAGFGLLPQSGTSGVVNRLLEYFGYQPPDWTRNLKPGDI